MIHVRYEEDGGPQRGMGKAIWSSLKSKPLLIMENNWNLIIGNLKGNAKVIQLLLFTKILRNIGSSNIYF